jgi:hypothetical protein
MPCRGRECTCSYTWPTNYIIRNLVFSVMRHNGSFGVRFPLILRGRRLLINSLLNNAFK